MLDLGGDWGSTLPGALANRVAEVLQLSQGDKDSLIHAAKSPEANTERGRDALGELLTAVLKGSDLGHLDGFVYHNEYEALGMSAIPLRHLPVLEGRLYQMPESAPDSLCGPAARLDSRRRQPPH